MEVDNPGFNVLFFLPELNFSEVLPFFPPLNYYLTSLNPYYIIYKIRILCYK